MYKYISRFQTTIHSILVDTTICIPIHACTSQTTIHSKYVCITCIKHILILRSLIQQQLVRPNTLSISENRATGSETSFEKKKKGSET